MRDPGGKVHSDNWQEWQDEDRVRLETASRRQAQRRLQSLRKKRPTFPSQPQPADSSKGLLGLSPQSVFNSFQVPEHKGVCVLSLCAKHLNFLLGAVGETLKNLRREGWPAGVSPRQILLAAMWSGWKVPKVGSGQVLLVRSSESPNKSEELWEPEGVWRDRPLSESYPTYLPVTTSSLGPRAGSEFLSLFVLSVK